jgi:hypothetical protein
MNPLSLLTKGRTIRGLKERPGPYKLLEKNAVPNFSGLKSPTTLHPEPSGPQPGLFKEEARESAYPATIEEELPKAELAEPAPSDLSVARLGAVVPVAGSGGGVSSPGPAPGVMSAEPAAVPATLQKRASKPGRASRLLGGLARRTRRWMPWAKEQPFQIAAVQTELALDKVKVVRNDLSEDDLEVVAIPKKADTKTGKTAQGEEAEKRTANP